MVASLCTGASMPADRNVRRGGVRGDMPELGKGGNTVTGAVPVTLELFGESDPVVSARSSSPRRAGLAVRRRGLRDNQPSVEPGALRHRPADAAAINRAEADVARTTERRPVLHPDGTIEMSAGPVECKRR